MDIIKISAADVLPIRHQVLWPSKPMSFCAVEGDEHATHYGAYIDDRLVCVASVYVEEKQARLRKFATLQEYQGQGVGSKVIEHIIKDLQADQVSYFWCDARTTALGFYQRFEMQVEGVEFQKSGVSYYKISVQWGERLSL